MQVLYDDGELGAPRLLNLDESKFKAQQFGRLAESFLGLPGMGETNVVWSTGGPAATTMPVVRADGGVLCVIWIIGHPAAHHDETFTVDFRIRKLPHTHRTRDSTPYNEYYMVTKKGSLDSKAFLAIAEVIGQEWKQAHPGLRAYLVYDRVSTHTFREAIEMFDKYMISVIFLPGNTSNTTQPLDQTVIAVAKELFYKTVTEMKLAAHRAGDIPKFAIRDAARDAVTAALAPNVVQKSREACGLWALDNDGDS